MIKSPTHDDDLDDDMSENAIAKQQAAARNQGYDYNTVKQRTIKEKLEAATVCVQNFDFEGALMLFNKVIFYDKTIAEVYAEKAELYMKMCDFSSAIQQFKKALYFKHDDTW